MIKTCDDGEERIRKVWRNHTWSVPLILPFHWLPNTTPCRCPLPRNLLKKNPLIPTELPASPRPDHHFQFQPPPWWGGHVRGHASYAWKFMEVGPSLIPNTASFSGWVRKEKKKEKRKEKKNLCYKNNKKTKSNCFLNGVYKYAPLW